MGICPGFAVQLRQSLLKGHSTFPLRTLDPNRVLEDTTILLVDLTQLLYVGKHLGGATITHTYPDLQSFAESSDPIGEFAVDRGTIKNTLNIFSQDTASDLILRRILSIRSKWNAHCGTNKVNNNLCSIYIILDGDSPVAKAETRRLRSSKTDVHRILRCLGEEGLDIAKYEARIRHRFYQMARVDDHRLMGSLVRYIVKRENRSAVIEQCINNLREMGCKEQTNLILIKGMEKGNPRGRITQIWGEDPDLGTRLSHEIPYYEADSIIPYIWAKIKSPADRACIISCDSDMLLTLLALGDPQLYLWSSASLNGIERQSMKHGRVVLSCTLEELSPKTHLNLLAHLTMGGCDYAESLPQCGAVRLMKGCEQILTGSADLFPNLRFATLSDIGDVAQEHESGEVLVRLEHAHMEEEMHAWHKVRDVIRYRDDLYPVRLGKYVYLVVLTNRCSAKILGAYNRMNRCRCFALLSDKVCNSFEWSMRRRLFFLSFISESRMGLEEGMAHDENIATKCGFSYRDFLFLNKIH